jgi:hypothetical protein
MYISERQEKNNRAEEIFEDILAKKPLKLIKYIKPQIS